MDHLSKDRVETIKARYKYYLDKPESTFDGLPMVAMILDLEEAREHRRILREWIEKDKTGLYAALTKVIKAIEARGWITDGRGPYEWDDDRYRQETGWAFDEVRKIVVEAQKESDKRMEKALAATEEKNDE